MNTNFDVVYDGLKFSEIGSWAEDKYRLVTLYAELFCISMIRKWGALVYLDLFSGPGYGKFRDTDRFVLTSPLRILKANNQFSRYIFADSSSSNIRALELRVNRDFSERDIRIMNIDVNKNADKILDALPIHSKEFTVLSLCFLDPFNMKNLYFDTIRHLSVRRMDFLVLIPSGVEVRNETKFLKQNNMVLKRFLGSRDWRDRWLIKKSKGSSFELFMVEEFTRSMEKLGYLDPGLDNTVLVKSDKKNLPLYRLVLYSQHKLGKQFWRQAKKYSAPQRDLFEN